MDELNDWEHAIRTENQPSNENVFTTLKEALLHAQDHSDEYDQVFIILHKRDENENLTTQWFNGGFRFSELIFIFDYLNHDLLNRIHNGEM